MDNKSSIRRITRFYGISFLITIFAIVISLFIKYEHSGIVVIVGFILFCLLFVAYYLGGYYYVEIEVENNSILKIKHYHLFVVGRKFKMYQIQLKRLYKIEVKDYLFGLFTFVYVYEQSKKGISSYPKIGFSAFPKSQKKKAIALLNRLVGTK